MTKSEKAGKPVQVLLTPSYIKLTGKILTAISPFLGSRFTAWLFLKPYKYKLPEREVEIDKIFHHKQITVPSIEREIVVYFNNSAASGKKVLLAHGWSGRGTQMPDIAFKLIDSGYEILSFDAPAHGRAPGKMSMMPHFIESILHLEKLYGPFYAAIGHSLGGMSLLNAVKQGLQLEKLVVIGTANSVTHITREFVRNLELPEKVAVKMKSYFDTKFGEDMDNLSGAFSAKSVKVPTLVVHDVHDVDVHVSSAYEIKDSLENGELYITEGQGHRKVLGDQKVINKITTFFAV